MSRTNGRRDDQDKRQQPQRQGLLLLLHSRCFLHPCLVLEKFSNAIAENYNSPEDAAGKAASMQSDGLSGKVIGGDCAVN